MEGGPPPRSPNWLSTTCTLQDQQYLVVIPAQRMLGKYKHLRLLSLSPLPEDVLLCINEFKLNVSEGDNSTHSV